MKMESKSAQIEYFDLILQIIDLVKQTKNSTERQRCLFYLRQLSTIKISAGDSEDDPTSLILENQRYREIFLILSNLGTESLLTSKEGEN